MLEDIKEEIGKLRSEAQKEFETVKNEKELEALRIKYFGRKGLFSQIISKIETLEASERPEAGFLINTLKNEIMELFQLRKEKLTAESQAEGRSLDLTLPGRRREYGSLHPVTLILDQILSIFTDLGFEVIESREVETEYYNFEALNTPKDHPARDMHNTFYITDEILLRTHTSPVQIRVMEKSRPPIRMVSPGKCYRRDASDASHSPVFHQLEGLLVDEDISFADLKGVLSSFLMQLFGKDTVVRFNPSYFQFTEPSTEVAIQCKMCRGKGCRICGNGYLEILGAGMVHPEVFRAVKYDPKKYTGFAFGMGVERIAMLKYNIDDIRLFFENDIRFLRQF